jgi:hypothetical protein
MPGMFSGCCCDANSCILQRYAAARNHENSEYTFGEFPNDFTAFEGIGGDQTWTGEVQPGGDPYYIPDTPGIGVLDQAGGATTNPPFDRMWTFLYVVSANYRFEYTYTFFDRQKMRIWFPAVGCVGFYKTFDKFTTAELQSVQEISFALAGEYVDVEPPTPDDPEAEVFTTQRLSFAVFFPGVSAEFVPDEFISTMTFPI